MKKIEILEILYSEMETEVQMLPRCSVQKGSSYSEKPKHFLECLLYLADVSKLFFNSI